MVNYPQYETCPPDVLNLVTSPLPFLPPYSHLPKLASPPAAGAVDSAGFDAGEAAWVFRLHTELGSSKEVKEPHPIFQTFLSQDSRVSMLVGLGM